MLVGVTVHRGGPVTLVGGAPTAEGGRLAECVDGPVQGRESCRFPPRIQIGRSLQRNYSWPEKSLRRSRPIGLSGRTRRARTR
jgi:hypothetical protein